MRRNIVVVVVVVVAIVGMVLLGVEGFRLLDTEGQRQTRGNLFLNLSAELFGIVATVIGIQQLFAWKERQQWRPAELLMYAALLETINALLVSILPGFTSRIDIEPKISKYASIEADVEHSEEFEEEVSRRMSASGLEEERRKEARKKSIEARDQSNLRHYEGPGGLLHCYESQKSLHFGKQGSVWRRLLHSIVRRVGPPPLREILQIIEPISRVDRLKLLVNPDDLYERDVYWFIEAGLDHKVPNPKLLKEFVDELSKSHSRMRYVLDSAARFLEPELMVKLYKLDLQVDYAIKGIELGMVHLGCLMC